MSTIVSTLTIVSAIGCGLMAGLFFAFSTSVMGALQRQPAAAGISAMQSINVTIVNPVFLLVFLGTPLACLALAITAGLSDDPHKVWRIAAAALVIVGVMIVTFAINIPLNDKLDAVDPASPYGAEVWDGYLSKWTNWNHVRGIAATAAAVILTTVSRT